MVEVHTGQCGLCSHFGEHDHNAEEDLVEIRESHNAPEDLLEECGHPKHAVLHLKVTAHSGCDGFEPAEVH
jgi:hypothetical protein